MLSSTLSAKVAWTWLSDDTSAAFPPLVPTELRRKSEASHDGPARQVLEAGAKRARTDYEEGRPPKSRRVGAGGADDLDEAEDVGGGASIALSYYDAVMETSRDRGGSADRASNIERLNAAASAENAERDVTALLPGPPHKGGADGEQYPSAYPATNVAAPPIQPSSAQHTAVTDTPTFTTNPVPTHAILTATPVFEASMTDQGWELLHPSGWVDGTERLASEWQQIANRLNIAYRAATEDCRCTYAFACITCARCCYIELRHLDLAGELSGGGESGVVDTIFVLVCAQCMVEEHGEDDYAVAAEAPVRLADPAMRQWSRFAGLEQRFGTRSVTAETARSSSARRYDSARCVWDVLCVADAMRANGVDLSDCVWLTFQRESSGFMRPVDGHTMHDDEVSFWGGLM